MNLILAICFLFVFCGLNHHRHAQSKPIAPATAQSSTSGKSCEQITKGFDSWGNQDDWVSAFPVAQQRRVLQCLDKLAKKQGRVE